MKTNFSISPIFNMSTQCSCIVQRAMCRRQSLSRKMVHILGDSNSDKRFFAVAVCELDIQKYFFALKKEIATEFKMLSNSISKMAEK